MAGPRQTNATLRNFIATTQGKSYTVTGVTILLVLVIFIVGVFPAISSILFQAQQNGQRTTALDAIATKQTTLRALSTEEESKHAVSLSLNANLPDALNQSDILQNITGMANSAGCTVVSITFANLDAQRNFTAAFGASRALDGKQINITVEGDRSQMETIITELETSRRIYSVVNFSMFKRTDVSANDTTGAAFRMDMQLEVYFWNKTKLS